MIIKKNFSKQKTTFLSSYAEHALENLFKILRTYLQYCQIKMIIWFYEDLHIIVIASGIKKD